MVKNLKGIGGAQLVSEVSPLDEDVRRDKVILVILNQSMAYDAVDPITLTASNWIIGQSNHNELEIGDPLLLCEMGRPLGRDQSKLLKLATFLHMRMGQTLGLLLGHPL